MFIYYLFLCEAPQHGPYFSEGPTFDHFAQKRTDKGWPDHTARTLNPDRCIIRVEAPLGLDREKRRGNQAGKCPRMIASPSLEVAGHVSLRY